MEANFFVRKLSDLNDKFLETVYQLSHRLYRNEYDDSDEVDNTSDNSDDLEEEDSNEVDNSNDSDEEDLDEEDSDEVDHNSDDSDEEDKDDEVDSVDLDDPDEEDLDNSYHSVNSDDPDAEDLHNSYNPVDPDEEDLHNSYNSVKCITVDDKEETKYVLHQELCHTHEPRIFSYVVAYINIKILYRPEVTSVRGFIYAMRCCTPGGSLLISGEETLVAYDGTIKLERSVVGVPSHGSLLIGAEQLRDQDDNLLLRTGKTFFIPSYPGATEPEIIGDGCQLQVEVKWSPDRVFN